MPGEPLDLSTEDVGAIDKLFVNFNAAWARGDADGYSELFCEDARFVGAPGFRLSGRDIIKREHKEMFDTMFRGSTIDGGYERAVQVLAQDVVLVHSLGNVFFPGQSTRNSKPTGLTTFTLVKRNSAWKIMHFQNTPTGSFRHLKFISRYLASRVHLLLSALGR